jgi:cytochrome c oxidase assembly protein subunit 15
MDHSDGNDRYTRKERRFIKISFLTICSLYLLILAGGVVRSTGSGMGCPDWPKCFNQWVPPTDVSELPVNYKEIYAAKRDTKNQKFANYLDVFGFSDLADKIRKDHTILHEADFNAANTWTEYVNRLLGALTGFLIILTVVFSWPLVKQGNLKVFLLSSLTLVLVGFQGWLGSIVVSTNLITWMVTVHMLLALVIVGLVIYQYALLRYRHLDGTEKTSLSFLKWMIFFCLVLTVYQTVMGTQVREMLDEISEAMNFSNRENWVAKVGADFVIHRSFSWVVLLLNLLFAYQVRLKYPHLTALKKVANIIVAVLLMQIISGVVLAYMALPPAFQPIHLVFSSLMFGAQILALILINKYPAIKK